MIRRFFARLRNRDGQALIVAAIVFPLVLLFLAFVVDVAHAFVDQRHLQNAADAAALAAAQEVPTAGCTTNPGICLDGVVKSYSQDFNDAPDAGQPVTPPQRRPSPRTVTSGPTSIRAVTPTQTRFWSCSRGARILSSAESSE